MKRPSVHRFIWFLFAVPHCAACHKLLAPEEALGAYVGCDVLCTECRANWEQEKLAPCMACGKTQLDCRCMPPMLAEAGAETLLHLGEYRADGVIGRVVLRLKDAALRRAADFVAAQLVPAVRRSCAEYDLLPSELLVTYLPRSPRARRERGHDQAELVAKSLAGRLDAEFVPLLRRNKDGAKQKTLRAEARKTNVMGIFLPNAAVSCAGRTVVLVDDVVTTGASMAEGVRVLRAAGAARLICAVIGVTRGK